MGFRVAGLCTLVGDHYMRISSRLIYAFHVQPKLSDRAPIFESEAVSDRAWQVCE